MSSESKWTVPGVIHEEVIPADPEQFGLEHYLTYRISRISRLLDRQTSRFLSNRFGISISERRALARLANAGPSTVRDISANLMIDKGAVSRALTSLCAKGYATRADNPDDGRSAIFAVTKSGQALQKQVVEQGLQRQVDLLNQLTPTERGNLYQAFGKMKDYLEEIERNQSGNDESPLALTA